MGHSSRSSFPRTGGRAPRRQSSWENGPSGAVAITADGDTLFGVAQEATEDGLTIIRTRGEMNMGLSVITGSLDGFPRAAFGLCIVNQNAAGVGVTAIPSPLDDITWDGWFVHWVGSLFGVSATEGNAEGFAVVRVPIDSKAMRKLKSTDNVVGVFAVSDEVGTAQLNAILNCRILVKIA